MPQTSIRPHREPALRGGLPWDAPTAPPTRADRVRGAVDFETDRVTLYPDTGCPDLGIPACLACPLPLCRYDLGPKQAASLMHTAEIEEMAHAGATTDEIAAHLGLSKRSVYRLKRRIARAADMAAMAL